MGPEGPRPSRDSLLHFSVGPSYCTDSPTPETRTRVHLPGPFARPPCAYRDLPTNPEHPGPSPLELPPPTPQPLCAQSRPGLKPRRPPTEN